MSSSSWVYQTEGTGASFTWTASATGTGYGLIVPLNGSTCVTGFGPTWNSNSATLTYQIAPSSTGSFVTSPIYSCIDGHLFNGSGTEFASGSGEAITGYTGSITGWGWGSNTTTCSSNTSGYPYNAGSANMDLNCCWPGTSSNGTNVITVTVTNGNVVLLRKAALMLALRLWPVLLAVVQLPGR